MLAVAGTAVFVVRGHLVLSRTLSAMASISARPLLMTSFHLFNGNGSSVRPCLTGRLMEKPRHKPWSVLNCFNLTITLFWRKLHVHLEHSVYSSTVPSAFRRTSNPFRSRRLLTDLSGKAKPFTCSTCRGFGHWLIRGWTINDFIHSCCVPEWSSGSCSPDGSKKRPSFRPDVFSRSRGIQYVCEYGSL